MDYREKILYLLNQHKQDSKELKASINELKKQFTDINEQVSIMSRSLNVPEFVDLGLPSGTKWMKCNIGAEKETDYGLYFQFGDTVGYSGEDMKLRATWKNCPGNGGNEEINTDSLTKWDKEHIYIDRLKSGVDAAYIHTNGIARMPTDYEFRDLFMYLDVEYMTNFNGSDINGLKFTSKNDNSKYIFLPASGAIYDGKINYTEAAGAFWSGTYYSNVSSMGMSFKTNSASLHLIDWYKYVGLCIRGVLAQ